MGRVFVAGYHKDSPEKRRRAKSSRLLLGSSPTFPVSCDNTSFRKMQLDQGPTGSCFPAGTQILMGDFTERPIEEVAEGNEVRTHTGAKRKVVRTVRRQYEGTLYTFRMKGYAYELTMTEEHPVAVVENISDKARQGKYEAGNVVWKPAREVCSKDILLMPAKTDGHEEFEARSISVSDYIEEDVWEYGDTVRLASARASHVIPKKIQVDATFAQLIGLFLAEGCYRKQDGQPMGLNFTFARHERSYQQFVVDAVKSVFGETATLQESEARQSVTDVRVNNTTLGRFFFSICGEHALGKRVPTMFYIAPRSVQLALLRGWLQGDGSSDPLREGKRSISLVGATSSESIHRGMFRIAMLCGLKPGANIRPIEEHQNAPPRNLWFYSSDLLTIFPEFAQRAADAGITVGRHKKYWTHEFGFACRVDSITTSETDEPIEVFNLEVEGEHTYVANAVAVHNCGGHGTSHGLQIAAGKQGIDLGFDVPSPGGIYTVTRCLERAPGAPLTDSGIMPADLFVALPTWGIKAYNKIPVTDPDGTVRNSDVTAANVNDEPNLDDLEQDAVHIVAGAYRIDETASDVLDQTFAAVATLGACGLGIFVDTAFQEWDPSQGPLNTVNLNDSQGGGHWIPVVKYDSSKGTFTLLNSWGSSFGRDGCIDVSVKWFQQAVSDIYAYKISLVSK